MKKDRIGNMQIVIIVLLVIAGVMSFFPIQELEGARVVRVWHFMGDEGVYEIDSISNNIIFTVLVTMLQILCIADRKSAKVKAAIIFALINALYTSRILFLEVCGTEVCSSIGESRQYKITWNGYLLVALLWMLAVLQMVQLMCMRKNGK